MSGTTARVLRHIGAPDKYASIKLDRTKLTISPDKNMSIQLDENLDLTKLTKPNGQVLNMFIDSYCMGGSTGR